jgi:hypothetical protein
LTSPVRESLILGAQPRHVIRSRHPVKGSRSRLSSRFQRQRLFYREKQPLSAISAAHAPGIECDCFCCMRSAGSQKFCTLAGAAARKPRSQASRQRLELVVRLSSREIHERTAAFRCHQGESPFQLAHARPSRNGGLRNIPCHFWVPLVSGSAPRLPSRKPGFLYYG